MKFNRILHGGDYNPEQWFEKDNYKELLESDIIRLKTSGINFVTVGVFNWAIINPSEGEYNFDYMDYLIKRYTEEGFDIIMSTPSGGFPNWLKLKYDSINRVDSNGIRRTLGDRHNHCYNSVDTKREISLINDIISKRYKDANITLWHISNEMQGMCYCESCVKEFRAWLKMTYGDIETLNEQWNMKFWSHYYNSFEEVNPPIDNGDGSNPCMRLAWSRFNTYSACQMYKLEVEAIKNNIPDAKHTTNLCYGLGHNFNYKTFSDEMDIVSWDSYHEWHRYDDYDTALYGVLNFDLMRGFKQQNFFMMESTPNMANWRYASKNKRPGVNEITSMLAIAFGSQSVGYFQMRRARNHAEMFHSAVLDDFVSENRFTKELKTLGDKLQSMPDILDTQIKNDIAIVFDYEIRDIINYNIGPRYLGGMKYCEYFEEIHKEFAKRNINTDVVNLNNDLSKYKAIVIPMHFMLSEEDIDYLIELANSGVKLYITAFTGLTDRENNLQVGGYNKKFETLLGHSLVEYEALYDEDYSKVNLFGKEYKTKIFHEYKVIKDGVETICDYDFDLYNGTPNITRNKNVVHYGSIVDGEVIVNQVVEDLNLTTSNEGIISSIRENENIRFEFYFNFNKENKEVCNLNGEEFTLEPYTYKIFKKEL